MSRVFGFRSPTHTPSNNSITIFNNLLFSRLSESLWFTRGWTLQELLAPSQVVFFAADWAVLGDRNVMSSWIADITGIHIGALRDRSTILRYSIAQRMSWASPRETTRSEDIAYCLLGIFNIHMPMLYGEGEAAFTRLQKEIMKSSDDHSIFSWELQGNEREPLTGALAATPKAFISCGSVVRNDDVGRSPFAVTNLGLSMNFSFIQSWFGSILLVGLNCARELRGRDDALNVLPSGRTSCRRFQIWIFLRHIEDSIYQRVHLPASTVFFQHFYTCSVQRKIIELFIEIQKSPQRRPLPVPEILVPSLQKFIPHPTSSSGLMITLGWGMMNRLNRFEEAFDSGNFFSQPLKHRSPMDISHQLVSSPNFTLLFSIAWDQNMRPRHWTHSVFAGHPSMFSSEAISVEKWKYLFNDSHTTIEVNDLVGIMSRTHNLLQQDFKDSFRHANLSAIAPIVVFSRQELQNLHGRCELVVDIIFRENPEPVLR